MTWWQTLLTTPGGFGATLGAGSSPFITAILLNRLITRGQHLELMHQKDLEIEEVRKNATARELFLTSQLATEQKLAKEQIDRSDMLLENERKAKEVERDRADAAIEKLAALANEFGGVSVHLLRSLPAGADDGTS